MDKVTFGGSIIPAQTPSGNPLPSFEDYRDELYPQIYHFFKKHFNTDNALFVKYHAAMAVSAVMAASNFERDPQQILAISPDFMMGYADRIIEEFGKEDK